jgi:pimeloyl-ACP methyl ester carboxylesterase
MIRGAQVVSTLQLPDGRALSYSESGNPAGPPCFYFHGTPGSRALGEFLGRTSKLRLINTDRPGYGDSTEVAERALLDWPNAVVALADKLELDRFLVLGASGGGPHALACGYALPDRVVACGVASGAAPLTTPGALDGMHAENRAIFDLLLEHPEQVAVALQGQLEQMNALGPDASKQMMRQMLPPADIVVFDKFPELMDALNDPTVQQQGVAGPVADLLMFGKPWGFALSDIKVPVFAWQGDVDANVPVSHGRLFEREIPNAKVVFYPGEGHLCSIEHQAEVEDTLIAAWTAAP